MAKIPGFNGALYLDGQFVAGALEGLESNTISISGSWWEGSVSVIDFSPAPCDLRLSYNRWYVPDIILHDAVIVDQSEEQVDGETIVDMNWEAKAATFVYKYGVISKIGWWFHRVGRRIRKAWRGEALNKLRRDLMSIMGAPNDATDEELVYGTRERPSR